MMNDDMLSLSRRHFLGVSSATLAASATTALGADANPDPIRIGVIGLGGRGSGAVLNALQADPGTRLIAAAEVFEDRLESGLKSIRAKADSNPATAGRVDVPPERAFSGFDGYKKLLETDVDVVLLTTPPHFRPAHAEAAVKAGKHIFAEKPLAVDPVGLRRIMKAGRTAAEKNLSFLTGFCYRYHSGIAQTIEKIHDGAIGDVLAMHCQYNSQGVWHRGDKPEWSDMERQMRNWLYYTWLSGDFIVEQSVHNLDKMNWVFGDRPPLSCLAFGGRQSRTDSKYGNAYDHFSARYDFGEGLYGDLMCRQQRNTDVGTIDAVTGTNGQARLMRQMILNDEPWRAPRGGNMYVQEHRELYQGIRSGKPVNNCESSAISTGMAIMARMSAYTGKVIHWDSEKKGTPSLMKSELNLSPASYEWGDLKMRPVPVPGVHPYV